LAHPVFRINHELAHETAADMLLMMCNVVKVQKMSLRILMQISASTPHNRNRLVQVWHLAVATR